MRTDTRSAISFHHSGIFKLTPSKLDLKDIKSFKFTRELAHNYKNKQRNLAYSIVGTPDYTAPEVFLRTGYHKECDYWSVGAILYEMLVGWAPFCDENTTITIYKIINCKKTLSFPDDVVISPEARDLISRLLCPKEERLCDFETIKRHPFFDGFDWDNMFQVEPPYVPQLKNIFDTSNFDTFPDQLEDDDEVPKSDQNLAFVGYTYKGFLGVTNTSKKHSHGITLNSIFTSHFTTP